MKKLLILAVLLFASSAFAQPIQCPDQPLGNSTNACANTRFVINNAGGGGISTLTNNHIFVGNASNVATDVAMSGDCSIVAAGAITCTKTNGSSFGTMATQNANAVAIIGGNAILATATLAAGTIAAAPVNPTDIANMAYVQSVAQGRTPLAPVRLATTAALAANTYANGTAGVGATLTANAVGALTIDSVATALNDRLLIKNEAAPANNGCYTQTTLGTAGVAYVLTRCTDSDTAAELPNGLTTLVTAGTTNINSSWTLNQPNAITVGTTVLPWVQTGFSSVSFWTALGNNIYKNNSGFVGFGTTTPLYPIDIAQFGAVVSSGQNYTGIARFKGDTSATNSAILFDTGASPSTTSIRGLAIGYQTQAFGIARFDASGVAAPTQDLSIAANGNVGIANTAPTTTLDVNGTVRATSSAIPASGVGAELQYAGGEALMIGVNRSTATFQPLRFVGTQIAFQTTAGQSGLFDTLGRFNVGTGSGVTGANFNVVGSGITTVTNPTMQQAICYGFESPLGSVPGTCETDAFVTNLTYTAGATTTGSAIRGTTLLQKGATTGIGVSGNATNYGTGVQSELVGVIGVASWYGAGSGNAVWAITSGTGPDSGVAGAFEASNKATIAPAWGLRINAESPSTVSYVTAIDAADFTSFGLVLRNTQSAAWPIYITNNVGSQIYGVNNVGNVIQPSDSRLKIDKGLMPTGALDRVAALIPRNYIRIGDAEERVESGFFAQELQKVIPEAIYTNDSGYLMLTQGPLIANLVGAVQELKAANDNLRSCQAKWKCRIFGWR